MKKQIKMLVYLIVIILSMSNVAFAEKVIDVRVNGDVIEFDNPPIIVEGRTLVPLRKIFEALDIYVTWDGDTRTVFAYKDNTIITIPVDSKIATIRTDENSVETVELDVPAQVFEARTYVPVRFIAESIGADVKWFGETRTVLIHVGKEIHKKSFLGDEYEGEMIQNQYEGYGKITLNDGSTYEGYWGSDRRNKFGKYIENNGDEYVGEYYYGSRHGYGKQVWKDREIYSYEGYWDTDYPCGLGKFIYSNGAMYEGYTANGVLNGFGKYTYSDGVIYEGEWLNDLPNGFGKARYRGGEIYEGNFLEGLRIGIGKMTWTNGEYYEGEWLNDKMINGVIKTAENEFVSRIYDEEAFNGESLEFRDYKGLAFKGPNYNTLLKNSSDYIGTPCYFNGKVVYASEETNGESFFLIDTNSQANSIIDILNFGETYDVVEKLEPEILAVISDISVDILKEDRVDIYGEVIEKITYTDEYGVCYTVPAVKIVYYQRGKRIFE